MSVISFVWFHRTWLFVAIRPAWPLCTWAFSACVARICFLAETQESVFRPFLQMFRFDMFLAYLCYCWLVVVVVFGTVVVVGWLVVVVFGYICCQIASLCWNGAHQAGFSPCVEELCPPPPTPPSSAPAAGRLTECPASRIGATLCTVSACLEIVETICNCCQDERDDTLQCNAINVQGQILWAVLMLMMWHKRVTPVRVCPVGTWVLVVPASFLLF